MTRPVALASGGPDDCSRLEEAGFVGDGDVYFMLHAAVGRPRALALVLGPFATERPYRYHLLAAWARHLARGGITAMRFDYRGVGESLGRFEDMSFTAWLDDVHACARWLQAHAPDAPLVLHGIGMGALLAERAFDGGLGAALLQWLPPASGQEMLYHQLRLRLSHDLSLRGTTRKTRDDYVAEMLAGGTVEVEGTYWTEKLWRDAAGFVHQPGARPGDRRPRHVATLDKVTAHSFGGTGPNPTRVSEKGIPMRLLSPDLRQPFSENASWIMAAVASNAEGER